MSTARDIRINAHHAFGFGPNNYIVLIWGKNDDILAWKDTLPQYTIFWNEFFHWFIPSETAKNLIIPENIHTVNLEWDMVCDNSDGQNIHIIDHDEVKRIVAEITTGLSKSEWQGEIGTWIECDVVVVKKDVISDHYGDKSTFTFEDKMGNQYVWATGTKNYAEGTPVRLKMKVKEHREYDGIKQTVVWYCKEK